MRKVTSHQAQTETTPKQLDTFKIRNRVDNARFIVHRLASHLGDIVEICPREHMVDPVSGRRVMEAAKSLIEAVDALSSQIYTSCAVLDSKPAALPAVQLQDPNRSTMPPIDEARRQLRTFEQLRERIHLVEQLAVGMLENSPGMDWADEIAADRILQSLRNATETADEFSSSAVGTIALKQAVEIEKAQRPTHVEAETRSE